MTTITHHFMDPRMDDGLCVRCGLSLAITRVLGHGYVIRYKDSLSYQAEYGVKRDEIRHNACISGMGPVYEVMGL